MNDGLVTERELLPLLDILRDGRPRTRTDLAELTGWARNTVGSRLDQLASRGWVIVTGDQAPGRGRPASIYTFNSKTRLVFIASLGMNHVDYSLTDLRGTPVASHTSKTSIEVGPSQAVTSTRNALNNLVSEAGVDRTRVCVAVIGLPSPVDTVTGKTINPSSTMPGWAAFETREAFKSGLQMPVLVENDANLMALGEKVLKFPEARDLIFVKVASGIGAGIIIGNQLQRGHRGMAGEIGHLPVVNGQGRQCGCGNTDCVSMYSSTRAIIGELNGQGVQVKTVADVMALANVGNSDCITVLRQAGRYLGDVLAGVVSTLSPEVLILGGALAEVGDHMITGTREALYARALPAVTSQLRIETSSQHEGSATHGAALLAVERLFGPGDQGRLII